ncbi:MULTISPECIES: acyl-CoA dehydrogenase [Hornefia]|jgi:butyryl-CoA dehydrogenase|uniref:Acyl-CoA dehydrogenase n=2 Tax=Hornefia TaxID=2815774 RepID=A0A1Q9JGV0_9FIRM|nr:MULTISPECIES: acyl-CoA dehydrogenase [Hornefia]MCI7413004.1 acyl-CoA dehydrogenase [Clostridiales bacterium]MCI7680133.1 acyl-CoA dehydrogenase [Clostridiales bacterium]MDD6298864.1 acyl-CoA dehydrogenase [Hornefia butyriciproducens]MDD7019499.1 acyl-CoA dehydrogenase [Hornefia butyriciproducens]MDY2991835.1 acyl-CoA dehydrogenase [Hornefia butyriciproducens]
MNFQLTKEQEFVRKMVREFATNEVEPLAADIDKEHRFPEETVAKMAKYGMMGIPFPTEYGGAGGDEVSYAITVEELSRVCASTGVIVSAHTSLCCWPIYAYGTEEQKQKYLPDLLSGRKIGAFGLTEPNAGTDAAGQQTRAVLDGDEWVLDGAKVFITNGGYASTFVVMAMTDKKKGTHGGISSFIVEKGDPGFSIGKTEDKMGIHASSTTELIFQNCRIPKDRLLGEVGDGFKIALSTLDGGRIGIASQALGIAQGAFDVTVDYMKARKQFGKKLSQMEALQFEMADLKTRIEAARLLVYKAAFLEDQHAKYGEAAAMAKLFAAETAMKVTTKCVQFHGGYGYTADYPVERMMRDAKITEIYEGTSEVQKIVIAANTFGK